MITIGAYVLADALRVFIDWITGRVVIWGIPYIFTDIFGQAAFFISVVFLGLIFVRLCFYIAIPP